MKRQNLGRQKMVDFRTGALNIQLFEKEDLKRKLLRRLFDGLVD